MCYPVQCSKCNKTSWAGCGEHVEAVMRNVSASDRCICQHNPASKSKAVEPLVFRSRGKHY